MHVTPESAGSPGRSKPPGNARTAWFLARLAGRYVYNRCITYSTNYKWFLAVRPTRELSEGGFDAGGFEIVEPPKGRLWADPFLLKVGGETHVFFEDMALGGNKVVISHPLDCPQTHGRSVAVPFKKERRMAGNHPDAL